MNHFVCMQDDLDYESMTSHFLIHSSYLKNYPRHQLVDDSPVRCCSTRYFKPNHCSKQSTTYQAWSIGRSWPIFHPLSSFIRISQGVGQLFYLKRDEISGVTNHLTHMTCFFERLWSSDWSIFVLMICQSRSLNYEWATRYKYSERRKAFQQVLTTLKPTFQYENLWIPTLIWVGILMQNRKSNSRICNMSHQV